MFNRTFLITAAAMAVGLPAMAQERGTVEFGGFASHTAFESSMGIDNSFGAGGRIGAFLHPRLSVEFEAGGSSAGRTFERRDINIGILAARLTAVPFRVGPVSALLGLGVGHSDTHIEVGDEHGLGTGYGQSYGFHGLLGAKLALTDNVAIRADWIEAFMSNGGDRSRGLHVGMSLYRNPRGRTNVVTNVVEAAPRAPRADSVSAAETRRLRESDASLKALRDSLAARPEAASDAELATMQEQIRFAHDQSDLDADAMATLREKVSVFRSNPTMRIVITGFASQPGTASYNMALGLRRAEAAKAYLVSQGIDGDRIEIATRGAGELLVEGPGEAADAANRRGEFRIQLLEMSPGSSD